MSKEYRIAAVSPKQDHWSGQYGDMITYYIRLEGEGDEAVAINKKPDSPAPTEGDELYGEIQSTSHGLKFKSQKKQFTPSGGGYQKSPEDKEDIARAVALKAAVEYVCAYESGLPSLDETLEFAEQLLTWLKGDKPATDASEQPEGKEKDSSTAVTDADLAKYGEPIDLKDIPF